MAVTPAWDMLATRVAARSGTEAPRPPRTPRGAALVVAAEFVELAVLVALVVALVGAATTAATVLCAVVAAAAVFLRAAAVLPQLLGLWQSLQSLLALSPEL